MQQDAADATNSLDLLALEQSTGEEWFQKFEQVDGTLTKCLVLVAVLTS